MRDLARFLRERERDILALWEESARSLPSARSLSRDRLIDFVPALLDRIATHVEQVAAGREAHLPRAPAEQHARDRLEDHYSLQEVVAEMSMLREAIIELHGGDGAYRILNRAIDQVMHASVDEFIGASDRAFCTTFENAAVGMAHCDLEGRFTRLNAKCSQILGATETELIGRDVPMDSAHRDRILRGERESVEVEERISRKDGSTIWIDLNVSAVRDHAGKAVYLIAIIQDIQERKTAAEALRRSEARLRCLAKAGTLLASTLDFQATLDHVAQMVVPELADWCAVDLVRPDATLGDFVAVAHVDPAKGELIRELRRRYPSRMDAGSVVPTAIRTGKPVLVEEVDKGWLDENAIDEGHRKLLVSLGARSLAVVPLTSRDYTFGALLLASAESQRRFDGEDLAFGEELARRAAAAIDNARLFEETRRAVELRDRILAVVSHDLRNPLGAIDLGAALLLKNANIRADPISKKQAETIQRSAGRMDRLISDLLDMSSIQAGRLSLQRNRCQLKSLLAEAIDAHEAAAREKGIEIMREIRLDRDLVRCDHDRIIQVLANLLGNAIKFCRGGDTVRITAENRDAEALVSVADTGPGIEREGLAQVFDLYWQGKGREHRGTGLGLFISRGIIEAHGGKLWVESEVGKGSTFFLTLPLCG